MERTYINRYTIGISESKYTIHVAMLEDQAPPRPSACNRSKEVTLQRVDNSRKAITSLMQLFGQSVILDDHGNGTCSAYLTAVSSLSSRPP